MYWTFDFTSSNILTLLEVEGVTLETILAEEDVLHECKAKNAKLIEFLTRPEHIKRMLELMITEPPNEGDEKMKYKLPSISSEILMSNVAEITDCLSQSSPAHATLSAPPSQIPSDPKTPPTAPISPTSPPFQAPTTAADEPTPPSTQEPTSTPPDQSTTDKNPLTDTTSQQPYFDLLFSFFQQTNPNPLQSSFVSKVVGFLLTSKSSEMLTYLESRPNFLDQLLSHISTSAIMDLVLNFVVNSDAYENVKWLKKQEVISKLVDLFRPDLSAATHNNVSQLLCDVIKQCREKIAFENEPMTIDRLYRDICNNDDNNNNKNNDNTENNNTKHHQLLLNVIQSETTVSSLIEHTFATPLKESLVLGGLQVLHALMELRKIGDTPEERYVQNVKCISGGLLFSQFAQSPLSDVDKFMQDVQGTLKSLVPRLDFLHRLLVEPPQQHYTPMSTTYGPLDRPFGPSRYQATRLLVCLLTLNYAPANLKLFELGTLGVLLDLFHKHSWNNFLHTQFCHLLEAVLSNATPPTITTTPSTTVTTNSLSAISQNHVGEGVDEGSMEVSSEQVATHNATPSEALDNPSEDALNTPSVPLDTPSILNHSPPLHTPRCNSVSPILDSSTKLLSQLLLDFHLLERVMDSLQKSSEKKSCGHGYTGHLTRLANQLSSQKHQSVLAFVLDKPDFPLPVKDRWKEFVSCDLSVINNLNAPVDVTTPSTKFSKNEVLTFPSQQNIITHKYGHVEDALADKKDFVLSGLDSDSLQLLQAKSALFENMCDERKSGVGGNDSDDSNDDDDDEDEDDDDDGRVVKRGSKGDDEEEEDDEVWEDKLANFPESLLKPDLLEKLKEVENEQKMETIRIKEATVVMATKEDGKLTSDVNKNVEDMDTSNGAWAPFEEPTMATMQTNSTETTADWADFSQLEKEEKEATSPSDQSIAKAVETSSPVTPPLASQ